MRFQPRGPRLYEAYVRGGGVEVFSSLINDTRQRARRGEWLTDEEIRDLTTLGQVLTGLFEEHDDLAALKTAIDVFEVMDAAARDYVLRPILRGEQAVRYKDLYVATGDLSFLEQAIALCEALTAAEPVGGYMWSVPAANLANYLNRRFVHAGRIADLERAMELSHEVLRTPRDEANHAGQTMNLGLLYFTRWKFLRRPEDLDAAVSLMEPVARSAPVPRQAKLGFLLDLAACLVERARAGFTDRDRADADLALADQLIATTYANSSFGSLIKALSCGARADLISARLGSRTTVAELDEDIELLEFCEALAGSHRRVQADVRAALARARAARFTLGGDEDDLAAATSAFAAICEAARDPVEHFTESLAWAAWAEDAQRWESAADAFRHLMAALHALSLGQYSREHRETWLGQAPYLADQAAYALAHAGDVDAAISAAETGRALLLRQAFSEQNEVDALRDAGHGELADTLDQAWMLRLFAARGEDEYDVQRTSGQYEQLLDQARALIPVPVASGDVAMSADQVREVAATAGVSLVYLCVAPHGGLAIVVPPNGTAQIRWLPSLSLDGAGDAARDLYAAYVAHRSQPAETSPWMRSLASVGAWCWEHVWGEVGAVVPPESAVALLPGGPLRFIPLHLAASPAMPARHLVDLHPVSYAPNAASVTRRTQPHAFNAPDSAVVHDPAGSHSPPAFTAAEAAAVRRRLPDVTALSGAAATRAEVLNRLRSAPLLHIACHGIADPMTPLAGGVELADGRLTAADLLAHRRSPAGLCVLSACETAISGAAVPNEVVGLPSALLQAGFATVVGTGWLVDDMSTALLMARFYDELTASPAEPLADVLRRAQLWLRDSDNDAKAAVLPEYAAAADALSPIARRLWGSARAHAHPFYWAAVTLHGAVGA